MKSNFKDYEINIKIKLAALWASVMLCYLYGDYFELYVPQKVEGLLNGVNMLDSPLKLFAAAVLMAIPAVMISLSVILKPNLNRWLNIIFGDNLYGYYGIDSPDLIFTLAKFLCVFGFG